LILVGITFETITPDFTLSLKLFKIVNGYES